jgi:hypothetical protein
MGQPEGLFAIGQSRDETENPLHREGQEDRNVAPELRHSIKRVSE